MAELPPVELGAHILVSFAAALGLRRLFEKRVTRAADQTAQPRRQFVFELLAVLSAGVLAAALNFILQGFPLGSGATLMFGVLVFGFFIGLDMALARERAIIRTALADGRTQAPPSRLYSMTRRFALVAGSAAVFITVILVLVISRDMVWLTTVGSDQAAAGRALMSVAYEILFTMAVLLALSINLIVSYSRNLRQLFDNETGVLERVARGDLSRMVPVATRDEFGLIAGHTNNMIEGLRHRLQLLNALELAEEVQRNLLPAEPPVVPGLDMAGTSIYCYETGGDYYDFVPLPGDRVGVVVADVSGHGVDAALFMTSARAFLLAAAQGAQGPARLVSGVNRHLTRDSALSGRFMTLFFLEIDPAEKTLRWVRGGHEPALAFNPASGKFRDLGGEGLALGVVAETDFREYAQQGWEPGTVIVIGTDGISETRNPAGEPFGGGRLREVVRANAGLPAADIQSAVIETLNAFRGDAPQEDDVTLVIVKLL